MEILVSHAVSMTSDAETSCRDWIEIGGDLELEFGGEALECWAASCRWRDFVISVPTEWYVSIQLRERTM